ncbi:hypothetical protein OUHCRE13_43100 [Enterobacter roggenkampii]
MSNIDKQALTAESARESENILLIVAARMARRELFTPLHYVSELPQKVVSMRVFREALERSEETLQREVCKIVNGHDRMQKKLKEAEEKLEAAEKRIAELEAREVKLPNPHAHLIWIRAGHAPDDYWDDVAVSHSEKDKCCDGSDRYPVYTLWEIKEALSAIGINIAAAGKGEDS